MWHRLSRRRLLAVAAGSSVASSTLAGCLGEDSAGGDAGDDDTDGGDTDEEGTEDGAADGDSSGDGAAIDEEFVDATGEAVAEIETRAGDEDLDEPSFVFDPAFVTVDEGTTIEWVNTDGVFHTVTSTDDVDDRSGGGDAFDATIASEGDVFEWEVDEPGIQPYYCSPHAGTMYGALEIV